MPTAVLAHLYKAIFSGTLTTGAEIFTMGFYFSSASADPSYVADNVSSHVTNLFSTAVTGNFFVTTMADAFSPDVHVTQCKVSSWNPVTNKLTGTPQYRALTDVGTGTAAHGLPYQDALSVSIFPSMLFGRTQYKNRAYLPPFVVEATNGHGELGTGISDAIGAWVQNQSTALESLSPQISIVSYSPHVGDFIASGEVALGQVIDTQRRRRNGLNEARVTYAL